MHETVSAMPDFQVFIKPVGAACNLRCSYCYYVGTANRHKPAVMGESLLELIIKSQIEATSGNTITFSWHGGEPLLAGIDFYRKAVALQKKYCPAGKTIINGIQTNGILIDAHWCRFLSEERFLVGLSLDGPERLHDRFRKYADNSGTFKAVMQAFDLLVMHGIDPEVLCVVSADNAQYPLEIYRFLLELGVPFVSFIPLVERSAEDENKATIRSVSPEGFGDFLCTIFDEWVRRDIGKIKIQIFEEAIRKAFGLEHSICIFRQNCGVIPVVEHNGNYYPCDHYVGDSFLAGNVNGLTIKELLNGERLHQFGHMKSETLPAYCKICEVKDMCNGECPKNRFISSPDGEKGLNYLCNGYRKFFTHCRPFIKAVADQYKKGSDPVGPKQ